MFTHLTGVSRHLLYTVENDSFLSNCVRNVSSAHWPKRSSQNTQRRMNFLCKVCRERFTHCTDIGSVVSLYSWRQYFSCKMLSTKQSALIWEWQFSSKFWKKNFCHHSNRNRHLRTHTEEQYYSCHCVRNLSLCVYLSRRLSFESGKSIFRGKCVRKCELRSLT
jgi:hypothetical protein